MDRRSSRAALVTVAGAGLFLGAGALHSADRPTATNLRFEVTVAPGLLAKPTDGRLLVVLGSEAANPSRRGRRTEPRQAIGDTGMTAPPVLGADVTGFAPGVVGVVDRASAIFPIESLEALPTGEYDVQAVFDWNPDLRLPDAPGNLYSKVTKARLDPAQGGTVKLALTEQVPPERLPADTERVKYVKLESRLLSRFHGRPMFLRAAVVLPPDFDREPDRRYPLRVHIGGYGTRFTSIAGLTRSTAPIIGLMLDGAGPYGDPYQVNSANNGPYGEAVTQELIPYVERTYRGVGAGHARFTDGHSTGGWVSFALQVFYPDFFNGCWSFCPDPVDFRAYELINIYEHPNAYVNQYGFERPAKRTITGETVYTVRHECQVEVMLGRGNRWWLSGKDWCAWNATYGPRGPDGLPRPLWDGKTGRIDHSVTDHWQQYDLRLVLERNWKTLAHRLQGKLHLYSGDHDDYFLNNAMRLLEAATKKFDPPFDGQITFGPMQGHGFHPLNDAQTTAVMLKRFEEGRPR
jgi:hypothetical protein